MPVLLKGESRSAVQLHMPRTGGRRLRHCLRASGVKMEIIGPSVHGPDPGIKPHLARIGTVRPQVTAWERSVKKKIRRSYDPAETRKLLRLLRDGGWRFTEISDVDAWTLGMWERSITAPKLRVFAGRDLTYYEAWTEWHYATADVLIPTTSLPNDRYTAITLSDLLPSHT